MLEQLVFSGLHFLAGAECLSPDISRVHISAVINSAWMLELYHEFGFRSDKQCLDA